LSFNPLRWFVKDQAEEYSIGDDNVLRAFYGALAAVSASGISVTQESSLRSTAVLACLIVRAESFSSLPVDVLRKAGRYRIPEEQHPAYSLLAVAPNELMTAGEFWRWKQLTEDIAGNAYARIVWGKGFELKEIWPLYQTPPRLVTDRASGARGYQYAGDDFTKADVYPLRDVLHFKGPVLRTPTEGKSLIDLASETIGVSIGSEQFFARLLGNGNHFPGYLETEAALSDADFAAIGEQMKGFAGIFRAGELRVFDRGLKYKQNPMSLKDAQLTEQQRWQLQQICSVFRVPMAMVQDLTNGTYSNSEQQDLALGKHCIAPICVNTEAVVRHKLFWLTPDHYVKFNLGGLLRGDFKTRSEGEAALVRAGIMTRNEARAQEDMNPEKGLDVPLADLNLGTVDKDGVIHGPDTGSPAPAEPAALPAAALLEPFLRDAAERIREHAANMTGTENSRRRTEHFARVALAPAIDAHALAGEPFDVAAFIDDAMARAVAPAPGDHTREAP
jgi:HK97 family phage portal protein